MHFLTIQFENKNFAKKIPFNILLNFFPPGSVYVLKELMVFTDYRLYSVINSDRSDYSLFKSTRLS